MEKETLLSRFDSLCVSHGDFDAIELIQDTNGDIKKTSVCYLELQELSHNLACQLHYRYRPDFVLVDCQGHAVAESIALLACARLGIPAVPVSTQHVLRLQKTASSLTHLAAVVVGDQDDDDVLLVLNSVDVHRILRLDALGHLQEQLRVPDQLPSSLPRNVLQHPDALYIMTTSGSTQDPKLVVGSQSSTVARLAWFRNQFASCRVAKRTPLVFVDGIHELWGTLLDPDAILVACRHAQDLQGVAVLVPHVEQITLLPSQLDALLSLKCSLAQLKRIIVSGEVCGAHLVQRMQQAYPHVELVNLYGQTETTGDVCWTILKENDIVHGVVPVGSPIHAGTRLEVKELRDTKRPKGDHGGLVIHGEQHALGYLQEDFTIKSVKEFATGDVAFARMMNDNTLTWYVEGRTGDSIKINGILTSLHEVEAALLPWKAKVALAEGKFCAFATSPIPSRQELHKAGIPWHLIPLHLFQIDTIPVTATGKVDRNSLVQLVPDLLSSQDHNQNDKPKISTCLIESIQQVLQIDTIKVTASFAELGGSSATAVSLLYLLKAKMPQKVKKTGLSVVNILTASSIECLHSWLECGALSPPQEESSALEFVPKPPVSCSIGHTRVQLKACVDASPVLSGSFYYIGCQAGILARVHADTLRLASYTAVCGSIQCSVICQDHRVYAFAHGDVGAHVACFDESLQICHWQCRLPTGIKTTPLWLDGFLFAQSGKYVWKIGAQTGKLVQEWGLPAFVEARPVRLKNELLCLSCESEFGKMISLRIDNSCCDVVQIQDIFLGPVYKDPLLLTNETLVVTDSWGCVHFLSLHRGPGETVAVSSCPLSAAVEMRGEVVVGSLDGTVYGLSYEHSILWKVEVDSSVYSQPAVYGDYLVVVTTAGDIVVCDGDSVAQRHRITGEIWSDPVSCIPSSVCFGARDSCLHQLVLCVS